MGQGWYYPIVLEELNAQLMQQLMYSGVGDKSGRVIDPYILVKNTITKYLTQIQECNKAFLKNNAENMKIYNSTLF